MSGRGDAALMTVEITVDALGYDLLVSAGSADLVLPAATLPLAGVFREAARQTLLLASEDEAPEEVDARRGELLALLDALDGAARAIAEEWARAFPDRKPLLMKRTGPA